ncbi:MAG: AbrB/MazE/SpoVT family DNA-binding domain-containing protein [Tolypothrix sp. T3-bin4]|nr:AbrB/MazE/SpoVT family DNA-binding domain-containing protein [Tolypothrix sp. T3-bin4]
MAATIAKWGNSLVIRIPHNLAKEIQITEGSEVELAVVGGSLVIKPRKQKRYSLSELVKAIAVDNLHTEVDSGVAVGNEVW